jgi:hypothetical protein
MKYEVRKEAILNRSLCKVLSNLDSLFCVLTILQTTKTQSIQSFTTAILYRNEGAKKQSCVGVHVLFYLSPVETQNDRSFT